MSYLNTFSVAVVNTATFFFYFPFYAYLFISTLLNSVAQNVFKRKKDLNGEVILMTGAASGIGQNVVIKLAARFPKAAYILWDINKVGLQNTRQQLQEIQVNSVHTYTVDLSNRDEIIQASQSVCEQLGPVTLFFNNAGFSPYVPFLELDSELEEKVIKINLLSQMWTIREFLPEMIKMKKGHIISTCSGLSFSKFSQLSSYVASKYGLRGFLETLKLEMRQYPSIRISAIYPGFVNTPMIQNVVSFEPRYKVAGLVPLEADKVAESIVDGILLEKEEIFVPGFLKYIQVFQSIVPSEFITRMETHIFKNLKIVSYEKDNANQAPIKS